MKPVFWSGRAQRVAGIILMVLASVTPALSQGNREFRENERSPMGESAERPPMGESAERRPGPGHDRNRREKAREMMMSLKIWKLTEELRVDEKLAEKLYPRVRELDEIRFSQMKEMEKLNSEIRQTIGEAVVDQEKLANLISSIRKMRTDQVELENRQIDRIFELLSPEQQAKFLLLEADFHQNIRRFLREQHRSMDGQEIEPGEMPEGSGLPQ